MSVKPVHKANKTEMISVRFDTDTLARLEHLAVAEQMPTSALIRKWTVQRLAQDAPLASDTWVPAEVELPED